jgi:hypothetical protein
MSAVRRLSVARLALQLVVSQLVPLVGAHASHPASASEPDRPVREAITMDAAALRAMASPVPGDLVFVVVHLASRRLWLVDRGEVRYSAPVAVGRGTSSDSTRAGGAATQRGHRAAVSAGAGGDRDLPAVRSATGA